MRYRDNLTNPVLIAGYTEKGVASMPIRIEPKHYQEGDIFQIIVGFDWQGVP